MTIRLLPLVVAMAILPACGNGDVNAIGLALVAHWSFDENNGSKVMDSSRDHHDGTINGSTWSWVPQGKFGSALHLGQGDYVEVADFSNATSSWTVSAWVQIASENVGMGEVTVVSTEDVFKGGWEMNLTSETSSSQYHFGYYVGPSQSDYDHCECPNCVQPDRWQNVAAVVDGQALTLSIYLDGAFVARATVRQPIKPGVPTLYMGRWATDDPARLFTGSLDDISIWNRALRPEEIAILSRAALQ
jgi:hypothetical protein